MTDRVDRGVGHASGSVAAVFGVGYGSGVKAEGHVVEEDLPGHDADVDQLLRAVEGGVEGLQGMAAVKPEIHGEVVAGPHRYTGKGDVPGHRNLGNDRQRTVTSSHHEVVAPLVHHAARQAGEVVVGLHGHRLEAQPLRCADQVDGGGAAVATFGFTISTGWVGTPFPVGCRADPSESSEVTMIRRYPGPAWVCEIANRTQVSNATRD